MPLPILLEYASNNPKISIFIYGIVHIITFNIMFKIWKESMSTIEQLSTSRLKIFQIGVGMFFMWVPISIAGIIMLIYALSQP